MPVGLHHKGILLGKREWVVLGPLGWLAAGAQGWADWPLRSVPHALIERLVFGIVAPALSPVAAESWLPEITGGEGESPSRWEC